MRRHSHLRRRRLRRLRLRRGVFLVPSLLTTANLFSGFASIILAFEGDFGGAAVLIIVAGVLDGLDGRIARMTGGTSEFGGEYDSLADVISFALAPGFLAQVWGLAPLHRYGWAVAFFFLVCGAVRLARFNLQHGATDRRWFVGLPSPMAAAAVAGTVLVVGRPLAGVPLSALFAVAVLAVGGLMVSRFRYRSFKDIDLRNRRSFRSVLGIGAAFAAFALNYRIAVLAISAGYVLSGPAVAAWSLARGARRQDDARGAAEAGAGTESDPAGAGEREPPDVRWHAR